MGTSQSFNFQNNMQNHITQGATALKAENDALRENVIEKEIDHSININSDVGAAETLINDKEDDSLILSNEVEVEAKETKADTNGLENFGIEEDTPDLFENNSPLESSEQVEESSEEDEFEIPAFLRRQKN